MAVLFAVKLLFALGLVAESVEATGVGDAIIWSSGTLLEREMDTSSEKDTIFLNDLQVDGGDPVDDLEERKKHQQKLMDLIKLIKIDVVDPGRDLLKMMNSISTKSRIMFLADYERYFKELNVGSTSRPMLMSLLGLKFAPQQLINLWYNPSRIRVKNKIIASCEQLLNKRMESIKRSLAPDQVAYLRGEKTQKLSASAHKSASMSRTGDLSLSYLVFKSNLNLFMLENYLYLCVKLEPDELRDKIESSDLELLV